MNASRLADLAWQAVDNRCADGAPNLVGIDADEIEWLLQRWPRGQKALERARAEERKLEEA